MGRTLVCGDIHGAYKPLKDLINKVKLKNDDELVFLGDYVDGNSESFEVIDYLIKLKNQYSTKFLLGNHDFWLRKYLENGVADIGWLNCGGTTTIDSYENRNKESINDHIEFLNSCVYSYTDNNNNGFVHGGFRTDDGLNITDRNYWVINDFMWDRSLFHLAYTHHKKNHNNSENYTKLYPKLLKLYKNIYIGHTSTLNYNTDIPIKVCNVTNLDTGGGSSNGRITIMDIDTGVYWQSSTIEKYY